MAKVKIAWSLSALQKQLMNELYWIGVDCVDACVTRYDLKIMNRPGKRTHQLRNSIACGVFENGVLRTDLVYQPKPDAGSKPKKWKGAELYGATEALRVLEATKPTAKISIVLVAAMPYRPYLEGANRGYGRRGVKTTRGGKLSKRVGKYRVMSPKKIGSVSLKGLKTSTKYYPGKKGEGSMTDRTGLGGFIVISDMTAYLKSNQGIASKLYKTKRSALANIAKFTNASGNLKRNVGTIRYR